MKVRAVLGGFLRALAYRLDPPEPLGRVANDLQHELNLLVLQGSWLPEDHGALVVDGDEARIVIRGADCVTPYLVTLRRVGE